MSARLGQVRTARLDLTPIDSSSADLLAPVFAKEEVWRFPFGRGLSRSETEERVRSWAEHWEVLGYGLWLVMERRSAVPLGYVGLAVPTFLPEILPAVEVGWRLDPVAWGLGYASEAARAALKGAFEVLELDEVVSLPQVENTASVRVAERIGMRRRRIATVAANDKRGPNEVLVMEITAREWRARGHGGDG